MSLTLMLMLGLDVYTGRDELSTTSIELGIIKDSLSNCDVYNDVLCSSSAVDI